MKLSQLLTAPNQLTLLRMMFVPFIVINLVAGHPRWALVLFVLAGFSDGLDGLLARTLKQQTVLGQYLDPIADKLLMTTAFIILTMPNVMQPARHLPVPFWVTAAVIGRDVLIITVAGAINIITGFRGFKPSWWGKASTFVQVVAVGLILLSPVVGYSFYLPTVYTLVALFAVVSGIHYIFHVARLMRDEEAQREEANP